tara:strand:- start:104 stop:280 length:177 start_codon:yes stop_codon:yes gene_type:complete
MLTFSNSINILKHLALYPLLEHVAKNCGVPNSSDGYSSEATGSSGSDHHWGVFFNTIN